MITFFKANVASVIASTCDYLVTIIAVQFLGMDVVIAGITGTISGGIVNFWIGRHWVFSAVESKAHRQAVRYTIVWLGNLLLNATGMYVFTKGAGLYYLAAKIITSLLVAITYNYPLQKRYVFKSN
jgi:putative flippase GtrA